MKKLSLTITLACIAAIQCLAQTGDTTASVVQKNWYCLYLHKSGVDKTLGWALVAPGAAIMAWEAAGSIGNNDNIFKYGFNSRRSGFFLLGTAMVLKGIPFLISAANNKHRAYLSLQRRSVSIAERCTAAGSSYAAICLKVKF